ncbi:TlpA disulfide reductase family protein [Mangrovibacterium marinum]|uniref:TlpA disulfide reductase family protein n=1 Tax=Mangrovibacterium marinum TaxID=1639118 RepID=UPI00147544E9|nr:TlpA disulfide reductase family protein [Mangrovibacterium marinum]
MSCRHEEAYTITGKLKGEVENAKIYLQKRDFESQNIVDSTVVHDGRFVLTGKVDFPGLYTIIIDRTPEGMESQPKYKNVSNFYLENSNISFDGDINTLPGFYNNPNRTVVPATISGSKAQQQKDEYSALVAPYNEQLKALNKRYMAEYLTPYFEEGTENTAVGIEIANKENEVNKQLLDLQIKFIQENTASIVAFDFVSYFFTGMYVDFTVAEIDEMVGWLANDWQGTPVFDRLKEQAEAAKRVALGERFKDIELLTRDGELVPLSSLIEPGKFNMLEFWASWCGPCRGEIPHLKRVHEEYKDKGFHIISISVDSNDKDWQKAMDEEGMVWTQLRDPKGMNGDVGTVYNVLGVPTCIVLDKDNRIYKTNMRGAYLDAFLAHEVN